MEKKTRKKSGNKALFVVLALLATGFIAMMMLRTSTTRGPTAESAKTSTTSSLAAHRRMLDSTYMTWHGRLADRFWLTGDEQMLNQRDILTQWSKRVKRLLNAYKGTNERTGALYNKYWQFTLTEFVDGASRRILTDEEGAQVEAGKKPDFVTGIEICVVPESQRRRHPFPSELYYRQEWGALMVIAVGIPDPFFAALLYHELDHAYKHQVLRAPSSTAPPASDSYVEEEVQAHELEHEILDKAVNGQLSQLYDQIMRRRTFTRVADALLAVTVTDLVEFDRLFGLVEAGERMASIYAAQFYMGLGIYVINQTVSPDRRLAEKVVFYRVTSGL